MVKTPDLSIETIEIDEELDDILKTGDGGWTQLPYPAVSVCRNGDFRALYFNKYATAYIKKMGFDGLKLSVSPTYVVIEPCKYRCGDKTTFKICFNSKNSENFKIHLPIELQERGVKSGIFKLYRCNNKFAFKRYEPINFDEEDTR